MTTTDQTGLFCSLLAYTGQEVAAQQFAPVEELAAFIDAGWLLPVARPATVPCEACDVVHRVKVVDIAGQQKGVCNFTGDIFPVTQTSQTCRVEGLIVARSVASALQLDGEAREVNGFSSLWTLGARQLGDTRTKFFLTPDFDHLNTATSLIDAVAQQSGAMRSVLIVANDRLDHVRLLAKSTKVIRLRDVARIEYPAQFLIYEEQLIAEVVPEVADKVRRQGRPNHAERMAAELIVELDRDGDLRQLGQNERHRILLEAAKAKHGSETTLSKSPCNQAWSAYIGNVGQIGKN